MGELCSGMLHNEGPGAAVRPLGQQLSCQEGLLHRVLRGELCHSFCFFQFGKASSLKYEESVTCRLGAGFRLLFRIVWVVQASSPQ